MTTFKKVLYALWIIVIIFLLILFILSPSSFTPEAIVNFLSRYETQLLVMYTVASFVRGLFLIPSTPFVLAGVIAFPEQPWAVFTISIIGVMFGSTLVYYFSDFLGFSNRLEKKYPKKIDRWHKRLNSPKATLIVIAWSFFPAVPTDVICYVAGIVKMPYKYLITGVFIGELVLVYIYVFYGIGLIEYLIG